MAQPKLGSRGALMRRGILFVGIPTAVATTVIRRWIFEESFALGSMEFWWELAWNLLFIGVMAGAAWGWVMFEFFDRRTAKEGTTPDRKTGYDEGDVRR